MKSYPLRAFACSCLVALPAFHSCGSAPPAPTPPSGVAPESSAPAEAGAKKSTPEDVPAPAPAAWTDEFMQPAVLIARTIRIEGPPGLREHLALTLDDVRFKHETKATNDGLFQRVEALVGDECRAQLDQWLLVGQTAIEVLEAPGARRISVQARGDALWQNLDGSERRSDTLAFEADTKP